MSEQSPNRTSPHSWKNKLGRIIWSWVWLLLYRTSPRPFHIWRCWLLRLFGATIERNVHVYPSSRIWAPWNLIMREGSCLGDGVNCYSVDTIEIGSFAVVSQDSFLCAATHDYQYLELPLKTAPIHIGAQAWVCADVFIGPGITIGEGAVIGARSATFSDIEPWMIASGSPAKVLKKRVLLERKG